MDVVDIGYIHRCLRWLANGMVSEYLEKKLPPELDKRIDSFYVCIKKAIDWYNLTREDFLNLGFMCWMERDDKELWLIPHWLFPVIPEGITLTDSHGNDLTFNSKTASRAITFGCLSYGLFVPKDDFSLDDVLRDSENT